MGPLRSIGFCTFFLVLAAVCLPPADQGNGGSAAAGPYGAEGVGPSHPDYVEQVASIDSIVMDPIREGLIAGASVAVVHRGEVVAIRGYGWADLELGVPTREHAIYEIGSVTKQFTSAALLQLQEDGLVDLDEEGGHLPTRLPDPGTSDHGAGASGPHVGDPGLHGNGRSVPILRAPGARR